MVNWYCKSCGSLHDFDDSSGGTQLEHEGTSVAGTLTCEKCTTRHKISDVAAGKFAQPPQGKKPQDVSVDLSEVQVLPPPRLRPVLGAIGLLAMAAENIVLWVWSAFGSDYVPNWYVFQVVDQGMTLPAIQIVVLLLICFALTSTYYFRPQLWYLAGIVAFLLAIRLLAFWFLGDDTLAGGATGLYDRLIVFILYLVRWLPLFPVWTFLLAIGGLQLSKEIGKLTSNTIFYSGLLYTFTLLMIIFDVPLSLYVEFPIERIALIICQVFCAIGLYRLSQGNSNLT